MTRMIKVFMTENAANDFATAVRGKITIQYDWDAMLNRMIKEYVVLF